jgi:tetratricopeptide (TPR) repeat protein
MEIENPNEWCVYHNIGDYWVRSGRYDEGLNYYRKALEVQNSPPLVDPLQAIAQLCEIRGDISGAIDARKKEADIIENQWKITGEELDAVLRDIARLEKLLMK